MIQLTDFRKRIFSVGSEQEFNELALELFHFQYHNNPVYHQFSSLLGVSPGKVKHFSQLPFLPVEFFRTHTIISGNETPVLYFTSSGTSGQVPGVHALIDPSLYAESFLNTFTRFYGSPEEYLILALLPTYLERESSSLVYMVKELIRRSGDPRSGFYLNEFQQLHEMLLEASRANIKTLLIGVSFALLDFTSQYPISFPQLIVMETGGMKGRRAEITRQELHSKLKQGFGVSQIHSEYGMTELLSQAYALTDGYFRCSPWMRVVIRESEDPLSLAKPGITGGINIIDLANIHSCAFIATHDLGKVHDDGSFEVLGRFDDSDIRGCNLLLMPG